MVLVIVIVLCKLILVKNEKGRKKHTWARDVCAFRAPQLLSVLSLQLSRSVDCVAGAVMWHSGDRRWVCFGRIRMWCQWW